MKYAEDLNYFDTTVHPAKSLGEIQELLENFGATATIVSQGQVHGNYAWVIRFQWNGRAYRFVFTPAPCRWPTKVMSYEKKKRPNEEQARWQMGRIALYFVKALLTAADTQPAALFGYMELPGARSGGMPPVASELDVEEMTGLLPGIELPRLEGGRGEGNNG
jgi:hypothetical protein